MQLLPLMRNKIGSLGKNLRMLQITSDVGLYGQRLTVALGFVTLASAVATFASCRSYRSFLERFRLKTFMETGWYRAFYRYHGYYWWVFLLALVLHLVTALMHTIIPTSGDPDAQIHWIILSFAFNLLVMVVAVLFSCRSLVSLFNLFTERGLLTNNLYQSFYRYHSIYWSILILSIAGHITSVYIHTGIWPS